MTNNDKEERMMIIDRPEHCHARMFATIDDRRCMIDFKRDKKWELNLSCNNPYCFPDECPLPLAPHLPTNWDGNVRCPSCRLRFKVNDSIGLESKVIAPQHTDEQIDNMRRLIFAENRKCNELILEKEKLEARIKELEAIIDANCDFDDETPAYMLRDMSKALKEARK